MPIGRVIVSDLRRFDRLPGPLLSVEKVARPRLKAPASLPSERTGRGRALTERARVVDLTSDKTAERADIYFTPI